MLNTAALEGGHGRKSWVALRTTLTLSDNACPVGFRILRVWMSSGFSLGNLGITSPLGVIYG